MPLVIKGSWQYSERDEEGDLLRKATGKGVINVARYYYHEAVQIRRTDADIRSNARGGLDITRAANYQPERAMPSSSFAASASRKGRSSSAASRKRSSSQTGAPPSKRPCSISSTKAGSNALNRVHRRVILRDYGRAIYKASSRAALLVALEGCIEDHRADEDKWRESCPSKQQQKKKKRGREPLRRPSEEDSIHSHHAFQKLLS
jgi:hypothetical protein